MKRSGRADAMTKLVANEKLSPASRDALIQCLDPFHDTNINPTGLPDTVTGNSVIQVVKKTYQISAPAGTTGTWQCHIASLPERANWSSGYTTDFVTCQVANVDAWGRAIGNGNWFTATGGNFPIAPMVIVSAQDGQPTFPDFNAAGTDIGPAPAGPYSMTAVDYNDYYSGQSRSIAAAFEVHNTTADLYKQGTATVYRLPQSNVESSYGFQDLATFNAGLTSAGTARTVVSRLPPSTAQEAMLLANSKQWEAAHGAYVVQTYDFEHNEAQPLCYGNRAFVVGDFNGGYDPSPVGTTKRLPAIVAGLSNNAINTAGLNSYNFGGASFKPIRRDTSGVFFTGLSPQSTMTLTVHEIFETFPTQPSPLVTMARPTPDYDPMFFAIYKEVCRGLPPGVMVGENSNGDFWDTVLDLVSEAAPLIGAVIPGGALIGSAVSGVAKGAKMLKSGFEKKKTSTVDSKFTGTNAPTAAEKAKESPAPAPKKSLQQLNGKNFKSPPKPKGKVPKGMFGGQPYY
jgi:hypothetical protein